jgi:hypothetical protein
MMTILPKLAPDRCVVGLSAVNWPQAEQGYGRQRAVAIFSIFGGDDGPDSCLWRHILAAVMLRLKSHPRAELKTKAAVHDNISCLGHAWTAKCYSPHFSK